MRVQQGTAAAEPASTPASIRAQMDAIQLSLDDAMARRAGVIARIDAAGGPSERVRLRNGELRGVDGEIGRLRQELAGLEAELQVREAAADRPAQPVVTQPASPIELAPPAPPPSQAITTVPPAAGMNFNSLLVGGLASLVLIAPLIFFVAWRAGRRAALAARRPQWEDDGARLARMEEAIASIGLEVDRITEGQRFLTNALVADAAHMPVREQLAARR